MSDVPMSDARLEIKIDIWAGEQLPPFACNHAMTFNSHGLIGFLLNRHFAQILESLWWAGQKARFNLGILPVMF